VPAAAGERASPNQEGPHEREERLAAESLSDQPNLTQHYTWGTSYIERRDWWGAAQSASALNLGRI